jgi:hypothetical protein
MEYIIRHVTIANGGHRYNGPPERVGNGLEERILRASFREVNRTGEENHTCKTREDMKADTDVTSCHHSPP